MSATTQAVVTSALTGYEEVLCWLADNRLSADPGKTKLIIFTKLCANTDLTRGRIWGSCYADTQAKCLNITTATSIKYLGVYITHNPTWEKHVNIMINCARSTIRGLSVLRNSI